MRSRGRVIALTLVWRRRAALLFLRRALGAIWRTVKAWWTKFSDWCERHRGLGTWAGAVGTIAAILGAWYLARAEYVRAQQIEDGRVNAEINLISRTASQFDPLVQQYIKLRHDGDAKAKGFYNNHQNDPPASRMNDFARMSITQWPSVEAYDAFKEYYLASINVLNTSVDVNTSINVQDRIGAYQGKLETLQKALNATRR